MTSEPVARVMSSATPVAPVLAKPNPATVEDGAPLRWPGSAFKLKVLVAKVSGFGGALTPASVKSK